MRGDTRLRQGPQFGILQFASENHQLESVRLAPLDPDVLQRAASSLHAQPRALTEVGGCLEDCCSTCFLSYCSNALRLDHSQLVT